MRDAHGAERGDRYLAPGTRVRLGDGVINDELIPAEFGVVVLCWQDEEFGFFDCYVAFFGDAIPAGKPKDVPYMLRYASTSLTALP